MKTAGGTYDGYVVERNCQSNVCVGVRGLGTRHYPGLDPQAFPAERDAYFAAVEEFRKAVLAAIGNPPSFRSSAHRQGCTRFGLWLGTTDATVIDAAIPRLGRFLAASDLKEEVSLCLGGGGLVNAGGNGG